jgi:hypothetical protein
MAVFDVTIACPCGCNCVFVCAHVYVIVDPVIVHVCVHVKHKWNSVRMLVCRWNG